MEYEGLIRSINNLPILTEGVQVDMNGKKFNFTKEVLKNIAIQNNSMLNQYPKTKEIPLLLGHIDNTDALWANVVFGYVTSISYSESSEGKGVVSANIDLIQDEKKQKCFLDGTYRVFSAGMTPTLRLVQISVVGDQAIDIANISNAYVAYYQAQDEGEMIVVTSKHEEGDYVVEKEKKYVEDMILEENKDEKSMFSESEKNGIYKFLKNFFRFGVHEENGEEEIAEKEGKEKVENKDNKMTLAETNQVEETKGNMQDATILQFQQQLAEMQQKQNEILEANKKLQEENEKKEAMILLRDAETDSNKYIESGSITPACKKSLTDLLILCYQNQEIKEKLFAFLDSIHVVDFDKDTAQNLRGNGDGFKLSNHKEDNKTDESDVCDISDETMNKMITDGFKKIRGNDPILCG